MLNLKNRKLDITDKEQESVCKLKIPVLTSIQLSGSEVCAAPSASTLLVADGSSPQIQELLAQAGVPVLWLPPGEEALAVVTAALAERRSLGQPVQILH